MTDDELGRLDKIAESSRYAEGVLEISTAYSFEIIQRYITGTRVLEMGPAEGIVTKKLSELGLDLTVVEGSSRFAAAIRDGFPEVSVVSSLFEDFSPSKFGYRGFDFIVCGHVLEHVENPLQLLRDMKSWLNPEGRIFAAVPNADSIHRQMGVSLGLLDDVQSLNELDIAQGHRRVFNRKDFHQLFEGAGLRLLSHGGYWLKMLSNAQIDKYWSTDMVLSSMILGEKYPDIAAEMFVVCCLS